MRDLPIDLVLPKVTDALREHSAVVVQAAPGAGKTTRVPAALLDCRHFPERIAVLEPRRVAAKAAAEFVARERGGEVGGEVGYRVRFEERGGPATRLWFMTEGMFTRRLGHDAFLEGTSVVVLDEFHERHLAGDFALASILELQRTVRPDLKLVVMSATIDAGRVAEFLGGVPVVQSAGRSHPVAIEYDDSGSDRPVAVRVAAVIERIVRGSAEDTGLLVFLPGAGEIRRTAELLAPVAAGLDLEVAALHGDLPLAEQYRVIQPVRRRRILLATNVAETALTVEGITTVVDSGLVRRVHYDTGHGLNRLTLGRISRASADQRAGRAGRLGPGRCVRLWSPADHAGRPEHETPEIHRVELSDLVLELRSWGLAEIDSLAWLDAPLPASLRRADTLLKQLGALGGGGELTAMGREMVRVSLPARLARLVITGRELGVAAEAALLAALASERDIRTSERFSAQDSTRRPAPSRAPSPEPAVTGSQPFIPESDLLERMELFDAAERGGFDRETCRRLGLEASAVRAVERSRRQLLRDGGAKRRGTAKTVDEREALLKCVLAAYPDRVVRRRAPGSPRGVMVGGRGVELMEGSAVRNAELFVATDLDGGERKARAEAKVRSASAVRTEWLKEMFPSAVRDVCEAVFDEQRESVVQRRQLRFHDLVLSDGLAGAAADVDVHAALVAAVAREPRRALTIDDAAEALLDRIAAAAHWMPEAQMPTVDEVLAKAAEAVCYGRRSFAETRRANACEALRQALTYEQRRTLDRDLPVEYELPNGRHAAVRYSVDRPPVVAARIQELFGLMATPRVARGRLPIVIELLAPNHRPVQVTDDLENFWRTTYAEVRKQLRGRYPKHAWPEDPHTAAPLRGVRR